MFTVETVESYCTLVLKSFDVEDLHLYFLLRVVSSFLVKEHLTFFVKNQVGDAAAMNRREIVIFLHSF